MALKKGAPRSARALERAGLKAYWIGEGDGYADGEMVYDIWICSNCGYVVDEGDNEKPWYNFCPNCGADMREE